MSAIARVLHDRGDIVSGSDRQENDVVRRLRAEGIEVFVPHAANSVEGADVVVYSAAVPQDNPEIVEARRLGLPVIERPELLGRLMDGYPSRVAVSGTHGKTTTTSMISAILVQAGVDATSMIGGDLATLGGNARLGSGSVVVAEACEAFGSFLHLRPSIAVITNIEADHLDHYGTIERIEDSFRQFVKNTDPDGCVIACSDDERVRRVLSAGERRTVWFGLSGSPDLLASDVDVSRPRPTYSLVWRGERLGGVELAAPGQQNVVDSLAAAAVAMELGICFEDIRAALAGFAGAARRFEILHDGDGSMVVDDYAHHPTEVAATLTAARSAYPGKRLVAVFQPHMYSRTREFVGEFAEALSLADEVIVTAIYAAREKPIAGVSGEQIVDALRSRGFVCARYAADKDALPAELVGRVGDGDMILVMGAGDVRGAAERLADLLADRGMRR